jgi:hypothetical protein
MTKLRLHSPLLQQLRMRPVMLTKGILNKRQAGRDLNVQHSQQNSQQNSQRQAGRDLTRTTIAALQLFSSEIGDIRCGSSHT